MVSPIKLDADFVSSVAESDKSITSILRACVYAIYTYRLIGKSPTDTHPRLINTLPAPEATEAKAGNCQRSVITGEGIALAILRGGLCFSDLIYRAWQAITQSDNQSDNIEE
jgi:hypothetical protein